MLGNASLHTATVKSGYLNYYSLSVISNKSESSPLSVYFSHYLYFFHHSDV